MTRISKSYPGQWGTPHREGEFTCMGDIEQPEPEGNAIVGAGKAIGITLAIGLVIYLAYNGHDLIASWLAK